MNDDAEEGEEGRKTDPRELKKFLKIARGQSLPFAFCPGAGEEEPIFALHRRRNPETMGKSARKESGQNKVAWGTFAVEGKTLVLTCERSVAGMDKKIKRFLRDQKVPMDVKLLDADGNEMTG